MKALSLVMLLTMLASCGGGNKVNSGNTTSGSNTLETPTTTQVEFAGVYDLVSREDLDDCSPSIRIERECNGYRLLNSSMGPEEFCNVNRPPDNPDRNPDRDPGRRPPHPNDELDVREDNRAVVTLKGNQLQSVLRVSERFTFTNTLTLNTNGVLTKVSNLKSRDVRCQYLKR